MSRDQDLFSTTNARHSINLGSNTFMEVVGKENVSMTLNNTPYKISDVYYIPELKNNLLSLGELQEKNVAVITQKGTWIYHDEIGPSA